MTFVLALWLYLGGAPAQALAVSGAGAPATVSTLSSCTDNGVVLGNATDVLQCTAAGDTYQVFRVPGAGGAPAFGSLDLSQSAAVTGTLPLSRGGTGVTALANLNNAFVLVASTVIAADVATYDFTSFTGSGTWVVELSLRNDSGSNSWFSVFVSSQPSLAAADTTATNYHSQWLDGTAASPTAGRNNDASKCYVATGSGSWCQVWVSLDGDGFPAINSFERRNRSTSISLSLSAGVRNHDLDSITIIRVAATAGNSIGDGSQLRLYRMR
ncbi:MAG TPA: hypothetical protein VEC14_13000 [Reyranellaceae bacterium]|nr:hypothetical protein [Reyranellaceae bacterium]